MKQGPCIDCGESRLRSALKIAGGSLSGGGSLGGPSLYLKITLQDPRKGLRRPKTKIKN